VWGNPSFQHPVKGIDNSPEGIRVSTVEGPLRILIAANTIQGNHYFDVVGNRTRVKEAVKALKETGIQVSLFIDPTAEQIQASRDVRADAIEIHTGLYCEAKTPKELDEEYNKVIAAAKKAHGLGLEVKAGHGLNYFNVGKIADIPEIVELSIGHSIVARSVLVGMEQAVRDMIALIQRPPRERSQR